MDETPAPTKRYLVVVVEDEADIRFIATEALADAGFDVCEAEHADEAVAILEQRAKEIHGMFTDVNMAGSMDGLALAHHSYRNWPWIVLLLASGRPSPLSEAMPKGSRFLPKPYHPHHVVQHLREMLTA
jgi:CheY-like chemotaxis protein